MTVDGIETTYDDYPNGLACFKCERQIEWGDPHYEWVEGMIDLPGLSDEPCFDTVVVCERCEAVKADRIVPLYDGNMNRL